MVIGDYGHKPQAIFMVTRNQMSIVDSSFMNLSKSVKTDSNWQQQSTEPVNLWTEQRIATELNTKLCQIEILGQSVWFIYGHRLLVFVGNCMLMNHFTIILNWDHNEHTATEYQNEEKTQTRWR